MLPKLYNVPSQSSFTIEKFKGINVTDSYEAGEFTDSLNTDSSSYPCISIRKKRNLCSECDGIINGVGSFDGYFYTYYNDEPKGIFLKFKEKIYEFTSYSDSDDYKLKRSFAALENSILIIPDNVVFFTDKKRFKKASIYQHYTFADADKKVLAETSDKGQINFSTSRHMGRVLSDRVCSMEYPYNTYGTGQKQIYPVNFDERIEVGDIVTVVIYAYSSSSLSSEQMQKLSRVFGKSYTLEVKGVEKKNINTNFQGLKNQVTELIFASNTFDLSGIGSVFFSQIIIEKKLPALKNITSHNNRIWGISGNRVYASRLGDADEWNDFSQDSMGTIPSASFCASAGTDGDFTAIIPHGNYIYALKENYIHRIYGDTPDEYTISNLEAPGCIKGADTACVCGIYLMYASSGGICVIRDGYPKIVSKKIGDIEPICAASHNGKYYLLCKESEKKVIYVYDMEHDFWIKESCADSADNLYSDMSSICYSEGNKLIYLSSENGGEFERDVKWQFKLRFDTNKFSENTAIRVTARISLGKNSSFTSRILYDDGTKSAICGFCYDETQHGSALLRLPLKRDLGFTVEFKGTGEFSLRNIKFNYYKSPEE